MVQRQETVHQLGPGGAGARLQLPAVPHDLVQLLGTLQGDGHPVAVLETKDFIFKT